MAAYCLPHPDHRPPAHGPREDLFSGLDNPIERHFLDHAVEQRKRKIARQAAPDFEALVEEHYRPL